MGVRYIIFVILFFCKPLNSGTFTEGIANEITGISNQKAMTWTPQFFAITSSVGYVGKQMFQSGLLSPIGFLPQQIKELSPLAYKQYKFEKNKSIKLFACNEKVGRLNQLDNKVDQFIDANYSSYFVGLDSNCNFQNSSKKIDQIDKLTNRYLAK